MNGIAYYYTDSARTELILTNGEPRSYPWHMHMQHWTVGVVSSGAVTVTTENGPKKLKGGEQFFIRPYEPHSLAVASKSSLLVFCAENRNIFSSGNDIFHDSDLGSDFTKITHSANKLYLSLSLQIMRRK